MWTCLAQVSYSGPVQDIIPVTIMRDGVYVDGDLLRLLALGLRWYVRLCVSWYNYSINVIKNQPHEKLHTTLIEVQTHTRSKRSKACNIQLIWCHYFRRSRHFVIIYSGKSPQPARCQPQHLASFALVDLSTPIWNLSLSAIQLAIYS